MNPRFFFVSVISALIVLACGPKKDADHDHNHHDSTSANTRMDTVKKSIPTEEHVQLGAAHLTIKYSSPAVRGRVIWGGLVPYGEVWVTGAHQATSIEIDKNFTVGGKEIPAGKYALFTIPGKEKWIVILNKNWDQHMAMEYDEKDDVARVEVTPQPLPENQERLKYSVVTKSDTQGTLEISWEKLKLSLPFELND